MSDSIFFHPDVLRVIRAVLVSRGIRHPEALKDGISDVVPACIARTRETGRSPETPKEAIPLARVIANGVGVNEFFEVTARAETEVAHTELVELHAAPSSSVDPVDGGEIVEKVRRKLTDKGIETLLDVQAGTPHAELAAESGISEAAHRKRVQKLRETAMKVLLPMGGIAAMIGTLWALHIGPWGGPDVNVAARRPDDGHPTAAEKQIAKEQRHVAFGACDEKKWDECERALDEAAKVDPVGDRDYVAVVAMRKAIAAGRGEGGVGDAGSERTAPSR